jgi:hypothetical protein
MKVWILTVVRSIARINDAADDEIYIGAFSSEENAHRTAATFPDWTSVTGVELDCTTLADAWTTMVLAQ